MPEKTARKVLKVSAGVELSVSHLCPCLCPPPGGQAGAAGRAEGLP